MPPTSFRIPSFKKPGNKPWENWTQIFNTPWAKCVSKTSRLWPLKASVGVFPDNVYGNFVPSKDYWTISSVDGCCQRLHNRRKLKSDLPRSKWIAGIYRVTAMLLCSIILGGCVTMWKIKREKNVTLKCVTQCLHEMECMYDDDEGYDDYYDLMLNLSIKWHIGLAVTASIDGLALNSLNRAATHSPGTNPSGTPCKVSGFLVRNHSNRQRSSPNSFLYFSGDNFIS